MQNLLWPRMLGDTPGYLPFGASFLALGRGEGLENEMAISKAHERVNSQTARGEVVGKVQMRGSSDFN